MHLQREIWDEANRVDGFVDGSLFPRELTYLKRRPEKRTNIDSETKMSTRNQESCSNVSHCSTTNCMPLGIIQIRPIEAQQTICVRISERQDGGCHQDGDIITICYSDAGK